jgi:hypothetical protein
MGEEKFSLCFFRLLLVFHKEICCVENEKAREGKRECNPKISGLLLIPKESLALLLRTLLSLSPRKKEHNNTRERSP